MLEEAKKESEGMWFMKRTEMLSSQAIRSAHKSCLSPAAVLPRRRHLRISPSLLLAFSILMKAVRGALSEELTI